jgi:hypothetical protein
MLIPSRYLLVQYLEEPMLRTKLLLLISLLVPGTFGWAQTTFPDHCSNGAALPFDAIKAAHPIDTSCPFLNGKQSSNANSKLQNSAKNNFCASGTPEIITPQQLIDLQRAHNFPSGQGKEPADRTALRSAGEGKLVRMKAYLLEAHFADVPSGESVNCGNGHTTEQDNDIHMAFVSGANDKDECGSVSGEISPHYRPLTWSDIGRFEKYNPATHMFVVNQAIASRLQAHPYRITGQLFFDASHPPCPCGTPCGSNPLRSSVWEIHPIYNIEVCKAGKPCDENNDDDWLAFDTWWKSLAPVKVRKPHRHAAHG